MSAKKFTNPFRPGAGHRPPFLAGRHAEKKEFARLLTQETILENLVLTGLRRVGKTVLLEELKPLALQEGWLWVGTDLSESTSVDEETVATRLFTDLSPVTSGIVISKEEIRRIGFRAEPGISLRTLGFDALSYVYRTTPGLVSDKLKGSLVFAWERLQKQGSRGVIFAYDEAQTLADHSEREQYPLSLLLDVFQSLQRMNIPYMLVLVGLPTLFPKLVESRTFAERMFRVVILDRLTKDESRQAITKPIEDTRCPVKLNQTSVDSIVDMSGGYPYFIQFICREVYDAFLQRLNDGKATAIPIAEITRKLDTDFFAGRWARATDRQRELLGVVSRLKNCDSEFTVQEIVERSKADLNKPFSSSHVNQMLAALSAQGLVFKNRHGKYSFAVPLMGDFIRRNESRQKEASKMSPSV